MYYELYIDVFFLENLMMDSLLLLAVGQMLKCRRSYGRIFLGGIAGSFLTCLVIAVPFPWPVRLFFFHVLINTAMLFTGLKITCAAQFAKAFVLLYIAAAFLGGIMQFFRPYMRAASLFYAAAGAGYFIFMKLWKIFSFLHGHQENIVRVSLYKADGNCVMAEALWDTGNSLKDFVTGEPVNIVGPQLARRISVMPAAEKGFHLIPYRCVGGDSLMRVFRIEKMCIHAENKEEGGDSWIRAPLIGISEEEVSIPGEYEMILNPQIML